MAFKNKKAIDNGFNNGQHFIEHGKYVILMGIKISRQTF